MATTLCVFKSHIHIVNIKWLLIITDDEKKLATLNLFAGYLRLLGKAILLRYFKFLNKNKIIIEMKMFNENKYNYNYHHRHSRCRHCCYCYCYCYY